MKKKFIIVFAITFVIGVLAAYGFIYNFLDSISVSKDATEIQIPKDRVNVLVMGVANGLTDTLMLANYNMKDNNISIVSIPRDTYFPRKGYKGAAHKKINAVYGGKGADGTVDAIEELLNTEIHFYFEFNYKAVISTVDAVGGIEVEVPLNMDYDDPVDKLHIHFKKGEIVKNGEDIIKILRWRKNNKGGGYKNGDLGRIEMQQHIVKLGINKLLSGNPVKNFLKLQDTIKDNVKTNMSPNQMINLVKKAKDIKEDNISYRTLPGATKTMEGLSFFVIDKDKLGEALECFED